MSWFVCLKVKHILRAAWVDTVTLISDFAAFSQSPAYTVRTRLLASVSGDVCG